MAPLLGLTGVGRDNALVHRLENREHGNGVGLRANSPKALFLVGESLEESSRAVWRIGEALHAIAGLASNQSWGKRRKGSPKLRYPRTKLVGSSESTARRRGSAMAMAAGEIRRFGGIRRGKRLGLGRSHTRRWEKDSGRFRDLYMGWLGAQGREDPERIGAGCTKSPLRDGEERKGKKTASAMRGRTVSD